MQLILFFFFFFKLSICLKLNGGLHMEEVAQTWHAWQSVSLVKLAVQLVISKIKFLLNMYMKQGIA